MNMARAWQCYGLGSLAAILVVGAIYGFAVVTEKWALPLTLSSELPVLQDFYAPAFWGGVWGLLYMLPLRFNWIIKGMLYSLLPALTHFAHIFGWIYLALPEGIDTGMLMQLDSLAQFGVYAVVWGLSTAYFLK